MQNYVEVYVFVRCHILRRPYRNDFVHREVLYDPPINAVLAEKSRTGCIITRANDDGVQLNCDKWYTICEV